MAIIDHILKVMLENSPQEVEYINHGIDHPDDVEGAAEILARPTKCEFFDHLKEREGEPGEFDWVDAPDCLNCRGTGVPFFDSPVNVVGTAETCICSDPTATTADGGLDYYCPVHGVPNC